MNINPEEQFQTTYNACIDPAQQCDDSPPKNLERHEDLIHTNIAKLKNGRIIQRNVIYVIGIEDKIASEALLSSDDFFGQYGEIVQIYLNKKGYMISDEKKIYYSSYVTYNNNYSAC